jgi:hypothetical protein
MEPPIYKYHNLPLKHFLSLSLSLWCFIPCVGSPENVWKRSLAPGILEASHLRMPGSPDIKSEDYYKASHTSHVYSAGWSCKKWAACEDVLDISAEVIEVHITGTSYLFACIYLYIVKSILIIYVYLYVYIYVYICIISIHIKYTMVHLCFFSHLFGRSSE